MRISRDLFNNVASIILLTYSLLIPISGISITDISHSYTNINEDASDFKIFYEICEVPQSELKWCTNAVYSFRKNESLPLICFFFYRSLYNFFSLTEFFNVEPKKIIFISTLNNSVKKKSYRDL